MVRHQDADSFEAAEHADAGSAQNSEQDGMREQIGNVVERLIGDEQIPLTLTERDRIIEEVLDEVFGLGPLEPLLKDPTVSDILVNGFDNIYVERAGAWSRPTCGSRIRRTCA
jgi:pilus assembly protein CpaF